MRSFGLWQFAVQEIYALLQLAHLVSEHDDCDDQGVVIVALLVSLNRDDGGEEDDDYDGNCQAF